MRQSRHFSFSFELREVFFKVGVDLVIYSTTQDKDLKSYYNRLQNLLVDTAEVDKLMKPLKVSRKSVVMKSASKCTAVVTQVMIFVTILIQHEGCSQPQLTLMSDIDIFHEKLFSLVHCRPSLASLSWTLPILRVRTYD